MSNEEFPVSQTLKVIDGTTINKTDKWWSAVVFLEFFGRKQVAVYLWNKKVGSWKRRQKFVVNDKENWIKITEAVEKYL